MDIPDLPLEIAPMNLETVIAVETLERACFSNPWSLDSLAEELSNPLAVFYTAALDGEIVGYAGMHHIIDEGYITNIAVSPAHRRKGIASALVEALLDYGKQEDLALVTLEVRPSNSAALELYHRFRFEHAGGRKDYYTNPKEDALILTRKL